MPSVEPVSPVLETLLTLLAETPPGRDRHAAEHAAERLDRLEYAARWEGAGPETLAAIAGARMLLGLAAYPVPRRFRPVRPSLGGHPPAAAARPH